MSVRSASRARVMRAGAVAALVAGTSLLGFASAAGATMSCGQFSFGFEGTRLLNDGISDTAGPFAIELPSGIYDVSVQSHDAHDEHPGQSDQTAEQWYFTLDSGYVSPLSTDIADESNTSVDTWLTQEIGGDVTSITLHHRGEGNVNSVDPICVGFTPTTPAAPVVTEPARELVAAPVETTTTVAPTTSTTIQVAGPRLVVEPEVQTSSTMVVAPPATIETEVAGSVEQAIDNGELLALTGPATSEALAFIGILSLLTGGVLVRTERAMRDS